MADKKLKIEYPHLILCEGADALYFLISYLKKLIDAGENIYTEFQVLDFGGIGQLVRYLKALSVISGYDKVKSITIIRDAESDFKAAIQSIHSSLNVNELPVHESPCQIASKDDLKVGFALFPALSDVSSNGTLEDLCLNNLSEQASEILTDIDSFLHSLRHNRNRILPRFHKSKLHTYFSITDKYVTMKIGEAAKANAFDFECGELQKLKYFLKEIAKP